MAPGRLAEGLRADERDAGIERLREVADRAADHDLDVDVSWFGTAIRRIPNFTPPHVANVPPLVLGMIKLGRDKQGDFVKGEADESQELEELAKKLEERASD